MCRNKAVIAIILCLCLLPAAATAQSVNLISEDMIVSNTVNYNTVTVEYGTIEYTATASGDAFLPYTYELRPEVGGLKFEEYTVERNQVVKAGDVLAVFTPNVDEVALEEQRRLLERTQDEFEIECAARQAEIDGMHLSLLQVKDSYESRLMKLQIERAELAFEQYIYTTECTLEAIRGRIDGYEQQYADSVIVAPVDGVVARVLTKRAGDRISRDETMIVMYRTEGALVEIVDKQGNFRYGMEVEIKAGNINTQTIPGRVVGADYMLPESQRTNTVYVQPEFYDPQTTSINNIKVTGRPVWLENVLTIPRNAMSLDAGKNYVMKYSDGMARKRYINASLIRYQPFVLQGLESGEEIIVN